jgi:hypothetical protein
MTFEEIAEIKRRAYETMASIDETLAATAPEPAQQWQPAQPNRYRGFQIETVEEMIKGVEARLNKRLDNLKARLGEAVNGTHGLLNALADEAGTALGEVERKVRDEYKNQIDALRNEMTLLRAQANTPARRQKTIARAPFKLDEDNAFRN